MIVLRLTDAEAEELVDLLEMAVLEIEGTLPEDPEDVESIAQKATSVNALFDKVSDQIING